MSSYKNVAKSNQKTHRERSQPEGREHLGLLEKKKDYKRRAEDFKKKKRTITALKRKALDKNPDEFYFKMVKTRMEDGVHQTEDTTPTYTEDQMKLIQTQDLKYVNFKRSLELKKIEKLKAKLHMLEVPEKPKNKHIVFLDSKSEVKSFDAAKHFNTHPSLLNRAYNRTTIEMLQEQAIGGGVDDTKLAEVALERSKAYKELEQRIDREKQLHIIAQKLERKNQLIDKKAKKKLVVKETKASAAQYKWVPKRQR